MHQFCNRFLIGTFINFGYFWYLKSTLRSRASQWVPGTSFDRPRASKSDPREPQGCNGMQLGVPRVVHVSSFWCPWVPNWYQVWDMAIQSWPLGPYFGLVAQKWLAILRPSFQSIRPPFCGVLSGFEMIGHLCKNLSSSKVPNAKYYIKANGFQWF